jgi:hypothetical protein
MFYCHYAAHGRARSIARLGYVKEPDLKKLAIAIFVFCLLESLFFFWTGWWAFSVFRFSGATVSQAFTAAEGEWNIGFLILMAGLLHWVAPRLRLPLAVAGVFGGLYAVFLIIRSRNFLVSWNILHVDPFAIGAWSEVILIVLAILCTVELAIIATRTT